MTISLEDSFSFFVLALQHSSRTVLKKDDNVLEYLIFEEFDIDAISFLADNTLHELLAHGFISRAVMLPARELRRLALAKFEQIDASHRTATSVRQNADWLAIMNLSDLIMQLLTTHSSAEIRERFQF